MSGVVYWRIIAVVMVVVMWTMPPDPLEVRRASAVIVFAIAWGVADILTAIRKRAA